MNLPDLPVPSAERTRRISHALPWLSAGLLIIVLVLSVSGVIGQSATTASLHAQHNTDAINACRSEYRANIDSANIAASGAESLRIDAISDILLAGLAQDRAGVERGAAELVTAKRAVVMARGQVTAANRANHAALALSARDQSAFLVDCRTKFH